MTTLYTRRARERAAHALLARLTRYARVALARLDAACAAQRWPAALVWLDLRRHVEEALSRVRRWVESGVMP